MFYFLNACIVAATFNSFLALQQLRNTVYINFSNFVHTDIFHISYPYSIHLNLILYNAIY